MRRRRAAALLRGDADVRLEEVGATIARARFAGDPGAWLPGPVRRCGPSTWTAVVHAGPASRSVTCEVGGPWRDGDAVWRSMRWEPVHQDDDLLDSAGALPTFAGEIGVVPVDEGLSVVVTGRAEPPGGPVGAVADVLLLHRIGQVTVARVGRDVAARLGAARTSGAS